MRYEINFSNLHNYVVEHFKNILYAYNQYKIINKIVTLSSKSGVYFPLTTQINLATNIK